MENESGTVVVESGSVLRQVHEVSRLTGVSIRTLQYYDRIGLLHPTEHTEAGYRLYDDKALETLQQILLFRELEFSLKDIQRIITSPDFDRSKAIVQQIELLTMKKEHIENLISLAREIRSKGERTMSFDAFDTKKMEEYAEKAKASWGTTQAYKEYEEKTKGRTRENALDISRGMMELFAQLGAIRDSDPTSERAQALVRDLQEYITENYYNCTKEILSGLGKMYAAGGEFTKNIDSYGGDGTAEFTHKAIEIYCR